MRTIVRSTAHAGDCCVAIHADSAEEVLRAAARFVEASGRLASARMKNAGGLSEIAELAAPDMAVLLADWINDLIGRSEIAGAPYACTDLTIAETATGLECRATLRRGAGGGWRPRLKAATYHDLRCERRGRRWRAHVLCDM